jgi:hypothetical protein
MTLTPINRGMRAALNGSSATAPDSIRFSPYPIRPNGPRLLVIWLGEHVAAKLGLTERRETVKIFLDESGPRYRLAIKRDPLGQFFAARKLRAYSVHLDAAASEAVLKRSDHRLYSIDPSAIRHSPNMVDFPLHAEVTGSAVR